MLQLLMLGVNAHINLDLSVAAARVVPSDELDALGSDFGKIKDILKSLVDDVQGKLAKISFLAGVTDRMLGSVDEKLINFSMKPPRELAWSRAKELSMIPLPQQGPKVAQIDREALLLGAAVRNPGFVVSGAMKFRPAGRAAQCVGDPPDPFVLNRR